MWLTELKSGEEAVIKRVEGGREAKQRLMDMGLTEGTKVSVRKRAPFRGPIEVSVRGSNLAIGHGLASKIVVEKSG